MSWFVGSAGIDCIAESRPFCEFRVCSFFQIGQFLEVLDAGNPVSFGLEFVDHQMRMNSLFLHLEVSYYVQLLPESLHKSAFDNFLIFR